MQVFHYIIVLGLLNISQGYVICGVVIDVVGANWDLNSGNQVEPFIGPDLALFVVVKLVCYLFIYIGFAYYRLFIFNINRNLKCFAII